MSQENICKFNFHRSSDLICTNFVRETSGTQSEPKRARGYSVDIVVGGRGWFVTNGIRYEISEGTLL